MSRTRIASEVDFDKEGKQHGFLRLPYSTHRSAYGWIPIPISCIKRGEGPTVLLISGNHGDEYEGQVALMKLSRRLEPADVRGRIIILSAANFPAAMRRRAHLADRRRQSQPQLSRQSRRLGHADDRPLHRDGAAAQGRPRDRRAFGRQLAHVYPECAHPAHGRCGEIGEAQAAPRALRRAHQLRLCHAARRGSHALGRGQPRGRGLSRHRDRRRRHRPAPCAQDRRDGIGTRAHGGRRARPRAHGRAGARDALHAGRRRGLLRLCAGERSLRAPSSSSAPRSRRAMLPAPSISPRLPGASRRSPASRAPNS